MPTALVAVLAVSLLAACEETQVRFERGGPTQTGTPAPRSDRLRIAAAGDVACDAPAGPAPSQCQYGATSDLVVDQDVDAVMVLGDTQYPNGNYSDYLQYYDPTWGRALAKTFPVLGDHEYETPSGEPLGYFEYFGDRWRGPGGYGYYSFDLPQGCTPRDGLCWHVIALNSELCVLGKGCPRPTQDPASPGERQLRWLSRDLDSHPNDKYPCTIAFFHDPLFSANDNPTTSHRDVRVLEEVRPLWELLYSARADIVLNGDRHRYERWRPLAPNGEPDDRLGIREFIVGTGGASLEALRGHPAGLVKAQDVAFGVLELDLYPGEYTWRWVPAAGQPTAFTDVSERPAPCS